MQQLASRDILEPLRRHARAAEEMQRQLREQMGSVGEDMQRRMRIDFKAIDELSRVINAQTAASWVRHAAVSFEPRAEPVADMAEWEFSEIAHGSF